MNLIEVNNCSTEKDFLEVNALMNKQNPNYIRSIDNEVKAVFDPTKNKTHKHGETKRWLLQGDNGQLIGRIAAFTNSKYINKGTEFPVGGIGFFDCIDNQEAANMLFNVAKQWLQSKGMAAMDGPINFGDRDKWWGLMVEGFDQAPMYGMSFNPPYYQQLIENYGFENYYNQYYYLMRLTDPLPERFEERYKRFNSKAGYSARHIKMKDFEKHALDFAKVYNSAWAQHGEAKEIAPEEVMKLFTEMKPIMDENLIWFAYYNEEPIAMWINIPDLNEYFKHFNGKLGLWQKLRLLWMKKSGACNKFTGIAFGVVPKYQALGIDSYMIYAGGLHMKAQNAYDTYEMGWAGEWNPRMLNIYRNLGAKQNRRMVTYRFLFDRNQQFERHPIMEYK